MGKKRNNKIISICLLAILFFQIQGSVLANARTNNLEETITVEEVKEITREEVSNNDSVVTELNVNEESIKPPTNMDGKENQTKPKVLSVNISKSTIYANISEDNRVTIEIEVENPQNYGNLYVYYNYGSGLYLSYDWNTGKFVGSTEIYSYIIGKNKATTIEFLGNYNIDYNCYIAYRDNDLELLDWDKLDVECKLYNPESIKINKTNFVAGEKVKIDVDLSNFIRDINDVYLVYEVSSINTPTERVNIELEYNDERNIYEGEYDIPYLKDGQEYSLYCINIVDRSYNTSVIYNYGYETNFNEFNFNVNHNLETYLYNLDVNVSTSNPKINEKVKIKVSGIENDNIFGRLMYINTKTNEEKVIPLSYNKSNKTLEGWFDANVYVSEGTWAIKRVEIYEYVNSSQISVVIKNSDLGSIGWLNKSLKNGDLKVKDTIGDSKAPEIKSVAVNTDKAVVGDTVVMSIDAIDDISGINKISVQYRSGDKWFYTDKVNYNTLTKKYEVKIKINPFMVNGNVELTNIYVTDRADNQVNISNINSLMRTYNDVSLDLSNATFVVYDSVNNICDAIKDIKISSNEVQSSEIVDISFELSNNSDIKFATMYYYNDEYSINEQVKFNYNINTNRYEGSLKIDEYAQVGSMLYFDGINFYNEDNETIVYVSSYEIKDKFENLDLEIVYKEGLGLSVENMYTDKNKVTINDSINFVLNAKSQYGDITKTTLIYSTTSGTKHIPLEKKGTIFISELKIGTYTNSGKWNLDSILLEDSRGLRKYIDGEQFSSGNFEVYGTTEDNTAPILQNVDLDKEVVILGDSIKISVKANDVGSGIKSAKFLLGKTSNGEYHEPIELVYNNNTKLYEYIIDTKNPPPTLSSSWLSGTYYPWMITSIILEDNAGNLVNYYWADSEIVSGKKFIVDETGEWFISDITDTTTSITGVTASNAYVDIVIGNNVYFGRAKLNGEFSIEIPKQKAETEIIINVKNEIGTVVQNIKKIVIDINAPDIPTINTIVNNETTIIEGKTEAFATVIIEKEVKIFGGVKIEEVARGNADSNGNFKIAIPKQKIKTNMGIKAVDNAGNVSDYMTFVVKNVNRIDVNYDGLVDVVDLALVSTKYNYLIDELTGEFDLDINEDGIIDIYDITSIAKEL